ncbi:MAG: hypothetical protein BTN85_1290 [Candidatus Methanohalarchaeum thermophilum]|uniref:Uncharacterized protein n=1 Tax=Methanohalarchaeum thermophilum TaxID=1903181 RepID=A0A1Q6DWR0_METT1|nr:MAG: hypothetical protein BTN85_1290 [Candidatus Methanohalarchaeum thermophilum]
MNKKILGIDMTVCVKDIMTSDLIAFSEEDGVEIVKKKMDEEEYKNTQLGFKENGTNNIIKPKEHR